MDFWAILGCDTNLYHSQGYYRLSRVLRALAQISCFEMSSTADEYFAILLSICYMTEIQETAHHYKY